MNKLNVAQKQKFLTDEGIVLYPYSGRLADAPRQYRHIFRDLKAATYVIDEPARKVYADGPIFDKKSADQWQRAWEICISDMFVEDMNIAIFYVQNNRVVDFWRENGVAPRPSWRSRYNDGLYITTGDGQCFGPYASLDDALYDLLCRFNYQTILQYANIKGSKVANQIDKAVARIIYGSDGVSIIGVFFGNEGAELARQLGYTLA